mmetsp:Transcript_10550/g.26814  ORF Transcript_10550/g.26814 Transcript_10550/m.26814 type:complete len:244 (+) Transcript_10550:158-889(+)
MDELWPYHSYTDLISVSQVAMIESVEGLAIGRKRRALSSACTFFHGMALAVVGAYYVYEPDESLAIIAKAWDVTVSQSEASAVYLLARNLVMTAAVYLSVWGVTAMCLATTASPRTKKLMAMLNLAAALVTSALSAFHPQAFAAARCRDDVDGAVGCLKTALTWHAPLVFLDLVAILFAEAGPKLIRINDHTQVLLNASPEETRIPQSNYTIKKINSHANLIKTAAAVTDATDAGDKDDGSGQ